MRSTLCRTRRTVSSLLRGFPGHIITKLLGIIVFPAKHRCLTPSSGLSRGITGVLRIPGTAHSHVNHNRCLAPDRRGPINLLRRTLISIVTTSPVRRQVYGRLNGGLPFAHLSRLTRGTLTGKLVSGSRTTVLIGTRRDHLHDVGISSFSPRRLTAGPMGLPRGIQGIRTTWVGGKTRELHFFVHWLFGVGTVQVIFRTTNRHHRRRHFAVGQGHVIRVRPNRFLLQHFLVGDQRRPHRLVEFLKPRRDSALQTAIVQFTHTRRLVHLVSRHCNLYKDVDATFRRPNERLVPLCRLVGYDFNNFTLYGTTGNWVVLHRYANNSSRDNSYHCYLGRRSSQTCPTRIVGLLGPNSGAVVYGSSVSGVDVYCRFVLHWNGYLVEYWDCGALHVGRLCAIPNLGVALLRRPLI